MPFDQKHDNQQIALIWLVALFLAGNWAQSLIENIALFSLLGTSLTLYRLAGPLARSLSGKKPLAKMANCPARNRLEATERIIAGLTPLIICALYCCIAFPLLLACLPPSLQRCARLSACFNIYWAFVQMIPIPPLEGWYLADGLFELAIGFSGYKWSLLFSSCFGTALVACLVRLPLFSSLPQSLTMILFSVLSFSALAKWQNERGKLPIDFDEKLKRRLSDLKRQLLKKSLTAPIFELDTLRDLIETIQRDLPLQSHSHLTTRYLIALAYSLQGRTAEALGSLDEVADRLRGEPLKLLHELAYKRQSFSLVCRFAKSVYWSFPKPEIAVINGLAYAHSRQTALAQRWLLLAKKGGYETWRLLQDPLFETWSQSELAALCKSDEG